MIICKAKCVKKFKEHFKISIGNLKPPKNFFGAIQWAGELGVHMWGNRVGGGGGTAVGVQQSTVFSKLSKNPISYA